VGERLGWGGYLGAVIILAGILVAEIGARRRAPDPGVPSVT
jgi:drug/metabolite transporter (DMT)-like permease